MMTESSIEVTCRCHTHTQTDHIPTHHKSALVFTRAKPATSTASAMHVTNRTVGRFTLQQQDVLFWGGHMSKLEGLHMVHAAQKHLQPCNSRPAVRQQVRGATQQMPQLTSCLGVEACSASNHQSCRPPGSRPKRSSSNIWREEARYGQACSTSLSTAESSAEILD